MIGAVVVGYLAMAVFVFLTFTLAYLAMGTERAFQPGTYDVSTLWLALAIVLGFAGAALGGMIAARIGGERGVRTLLIVVVLLGLVNAVFTMMSPGENKGPRTAAVPVMEAMTAAKQPTWSPWADILLGAAGTIVGGRRLAATPA
jgi:hypothetical protein